MVIAIIMWTTLNKEIPIMVIVKPDESLTMRAWLNCFEPHLLMITEEIVNELLSSWMD